MASEWDKHWSSKKFNNDLMSILARDFVNSYQRYFGFSGTEIVLDFGASPGDVSLLIKDKVRRIYLFDKSKYFVEKLRKSFGKFQNIHIVNYLREIKEPVFIVIINSVVQYMNNKEIEDMLLRLHSISNLETRIIISDIVPPNYSKFLDCLYGILISIKNRFFKKYISYLITNIIYDPKLNLKTSTLHMYDEDELKKILLKHGYCSMRMENNFTYSMHSYTLQCKLNDKK